MFGAAASKNEARYAVSGSGLRAAGSVLYWLEDGCEADLPRCARALPTCEPDGAALADTSVGLQNMLLKRRRCPRCLPRPLLGGGAGAGGGMGPALDVRWGPTPRKRRWAVVLRRRLHMEPESAFCICRVW